MTLIDEFFSAAKHGAEMEIPESWGQGRTVFGGLSAGLLSRAMLNELDDDRTMRVQTVQFIGPLNTQTPFSIEVEHLRDGKNVTQMQARLIQDGNVAVQALAAFGQDRDSKLNTQAPQVELGAPPKKPAWMPQIPKVTPKFHRYIDIAIDEGGLPFTNKKEAVYEGWMRLSDAPNEFDVSHLIALIDVWPPTVLQQLRWPAPASTLSWNVEFVHSHTKISPTDWIGYKATTAKAAEGYAHTEAQIFAPDGTLIALSRQLVTVFG